MVKFDRIKGEIWISNSNIIHIFSETYNETSVVSGKKKEEDLKIQTQKEIYNEVLWLNNTFTRNIKKWVELMLYV